MARQRIHNSRAGRGSGNSGASWISYSDLMCALLLMFVLMLSVILYQYFTMIETKTAELDQHKQNAKSAKRHFRRHVKRRKPRHANRARREKQRIAPRNSVHARIRRFQKNRSRDNQQHKT